MKKIFFYLPFVLLVFTACNNNKTKNSGTGKDTATTAQNNDYLITLDGIGPIKTGIKQDELETLLSKKIQLTNPTDTVSGSWVDSARVQYKEADLGLSFVRAYEKEDSFYMRVTSMKTSSPLCKTQNGIGIGASKEQIIDAFENYLLIITPDYEDTTYTTLSKTMYTIKVRESWEGGEIIFYLKDRKVYAIEVGTFYDDSEG